MHISRIAVLGLLIAAATSEVTSQTAAQSTAAGPTFDVVSIKRTSGNTLNMSAYERPDGGFTMTNYRVDGLIARAYPPAVPIDMIGLPAWALTEQYDVKTTSTLSSATPDQRKAMLRVLLADRFKMVVHVEERELPAFDLVLARSDGKLGAGMSPSLDVDCEARAAAERAAAQEARSAGLPPPTPPRVERNGPVPPCSVRTNGPKLEGDVTMATLVLLLRGSSGRNVVDKTGLAGTYHIAMEFDRLGASRGQDPLGTAPDGPPSVFTAVQEQLGLKLVASRAKRDVLVIDRLEKPTEN